MVDINADGTAKVIIKNAHCPNCAAPPQSVYTSFPPGTFMWHTDRRKSTIYYEVHNYAYKPGTLVNVCMDCGWHWEPVVKEIL